LLRPTTSMPGSPIPVAVANASLRPNQPMRSPSPAMPALMPSDLVPGSHF
jgi:hypothetical protein